MTALLDINVLVALAWPNHVHHEQALQRFVDLADGGWSTCPTTQAGFVRLSSNPRVLPDAPSPAECLLLLRRITALDGHVFWQDDIDMTDCPWIATEKIVGHRQVTDAHLLALALRHEGRLATFDRGIAALLPPAVLPAEALLFLDR